MYNLCHNLGPIAHWNSHGLYQNQDQNETRYCSVICKTIEIDKEMIAAFQKINHQINIVLIFNPTFTSNKESDCNLYIKITEVYPINRF